MTELVLGVLLVVGLVSFKSGMSYWQMSQLKGWIESAQAAMQRDDWDEAQRLLDVAVKKHPGIIPVHQHLAIVMAKRGMLPEAEERFRFALDLEPKHPTSNFSYGLFLASHYPDRQAEAAALFAAAVAQEAELRRILDSAPELEAFRQSASYRKLCSDMENGQN